jgi:chromosome segregation ATPase
MAETRQRLEVQLGQMRAQHDAGQQSETALREELKTWQARLEESRQGLAQAKQKLAGEQAKLPEMEQASRALQGQIDGQRERIAQAEQAFQLEQAHLAHAGKTLQGLEQREERLLAERAELAAPDAESLARLAQELEHSAAELSRQEALLAQLEAARSALDEQRGEPGPHADSRARAIHAGGQVAHPAEDPEPGRGEQQAHDWIARHQLASKPRLWQKIRVEAGWETAVESACGSACTRRCPTGCCSGCSMIRPRPSQRLYPGTDAGFRAGRVEAARGLRRGNGPPGWSGHRGLARAVLCGGGRTAPHDAYGFACASRSDQSRRPPIQPLRGELPRK